MPYPKKSQEIQDKLNAWIDKNSDRLSIAKYEDITLESGVKLSTVYKHFSKLIAERTNTLPSEVIKKREEHFGRSPWKRKLSDEEIAEIIRLYNDGRTTLDVSFITGRSSVQCGKYKPTEAESDARKDSRSKKESA